MLILTRKESERIYLGDDIVLTIVRVGTDKVRIGVEAPSDVRVLRLELSESDSAPTIDGELDRPRRLEIKPNRSTEPRRRAA
ncbi:MAG: carbon storage regulator [Pirellula sp.]